MSTAPASRPGVRRLSIPTIALTFALLAGGADLSAQRTSGHAVVLGGEVNPGHTTVFTRSGAPGTEIKLVADGLPPGKDVQVMLGALRDGFEVVKTLYTDDNGRFNGQDTVRITVPDWVKTDRAYLVMLTDFQYNPLAAADMFHPTTADGHLQRRGTIKFEDPACPMLTAEGAEIYFLTGNTSLLKAGQELVVKGRVVESGKCGNVTTIAVEEAGPPPKSN